MSTILPTAMSGPSGWQTLRVGSGIPATIQCCLHTGRVRGCVAAGASHLELMQRKGVCDGPMSNEWSVLVSHYENCFEQHGASPKGADWPSGPDLQARFAVLLSILDGAPLGTRPVLLDVGCGCGLLLDSLQAAGRLDQVDYRGIDLSPLLVREAKARWPQHDFSVRDLSADPLPDKIGRASCRGRG